MAFDRCEVDRGFTVGSVLLQHIATDTATKEQYQHQNLKRKKQLMQKMVGRMSLPSKYKQLELQPCHFRAQAELQLDGIWKLASA